MVELYFPYIIHTLPSFICCIMSSWEWPSLLLWTRKVADNRTIPIMIIQKRSYSTFLCPSQSALLSFLIPQILNICTIKRGGFKGCGRLPLKRTPETAFLIRDTWAGWDEIAKGDVKKQFGEQVQGNKHEERIYFFHCVLCRHMLVWMRTGMGV